MLRCAFIAAFTAAACFALPATAQLQRAFPANALRGEIIAQQPPALLLNGKPAQLAPGARLHGPDNLMLVSGALAGQRLIVHYTVDLHGALQEVWVLTPAELARQPWPTTPEQAASWRFDPLGQTWSRP